MSKKGVHIADHIKRKRKGFIVIRDSVIDANYVDGNFRIITRNKDYARPFGSNIFTKEKQLINCQQNIT